MRVVALRSSAERAALGNTGRSHLFDADRIEEEGVDLNLCVVAHVNEVLAQCSLWWREVPLLETHAIGVIGHYASVSDEAAAMLLDAALSHLRNQSCTLAVGPMDGNTWRSYRFVTDPCSEMPFVMEPTNPPEWPLQFELAGFSKLADYFSTLNTCLDVQDDRVAATMAKMAARGVTIRMAEKTKLQYELGRIYQLSRAAFANNFLYTPITEQAFRAQYARVLPHVRPELVLLAERGSELVGYLFAIPDVAQAVRGKPIDTFVIKTVAILPDANLHGLGSVLVACAHETGAQMGFSRCIHALMHESNISRKISDHYASTMRRYTLYSQEIAP